MNFPKAEIYVTQNFEGYHCWPEAPQEVAFLRNLHRHIFNVKVWHDVGHNDRQIEFFIFKREVISCLGLLTRDLATEHAMSCEMMAERLAEYLITHYHRSPTRIEVNEDGENGTVVHFDYGTR